jgi:hypothetical protein
MDQIRNAFPDSLRFRPPGGAELCGLCWATTLLPYPGRGRRGLPKSVGDELAWKCAHAATRQPTQRMWHKDLTISNRPQHNGSALTLKDTLEMLQASRMPSLCHTMRRSTT